MIAPFPGQISGRERVELVVHVRDQAVDGLGAAALHSRSRLVISGLPAPSCMTDWRVAAYASRAKPSKPRLILSWRHWRVRDQEKDRVPSSCGGGCESNRPRRSCAGAGRRSVRPRRHAQRRGGCPDQLRPAQLQVRAVAGHGRTPWPERGRPQQLRPVRPLGPAGRPRLAEGHPTPVGAGRGHARHDRGGAHRESWQEGTITAGSSPDLGAPIATFAVDSGHTLHFIDVDVTGLVQDWARD